MTAPKTRTLDTKIYVGYNVTFDVTVNENSGVVYTAQLDMVRMSNQAAPFDLEKFLVNINVVAITSYVCFLRGLEVKIVDRDTMIGCLQIYSLTEDKNFFKYTLKQLFKYWILLSPVLYDDRLATEIKWDVWCHCPRQVLPQWFLDDKISMKEWSRILDNKHVTLNTTDVFNYTVETEVPIEISEEDYDYQGTMIRTNRLGEYQRNSDKFELRVKDDTELFRTLAGQAVGEANFHVQYIVKGGKLIDHGLDTVTNPFTGWQQASVFFDGKRYGPDTSYYHDRPESKSYNFYDKQVGTAKNYYQSGTLSYEMHSTSSGERISDDNYYDNAAYTLKLHVDYEDGTIVSSDDYYDDIAHTLKSHTDYKDGKLVYKIVYKLDGSHTEVTSALISYYDKDGDLTSQITNPLEKGEKHEITYNKQGQIISEATIDSELHYYPSNDEWNDW